MPFRNLDSTSFSPDELKVLYEAFDLAWTELAQAYGSDAARVAFARNTLAQAVLGAAEAEAKGKDAVTLKTAALARFAIAEPGYRPGSVPRGSAS